MKVKTYKNYFDLLRVNNYIKNIFVFAPMFFVFSFQKEFIINTIIAFVLFCLMTSGVYICNDLFDLKEDKQHPIKQKRPIVSGRVSKSKAKLIAILLFTVALYGAYQNSNLLFYTFGVYLILNIFYNLGLKKIPVVDILIISIGFVIRVLVGCFANDIPPTYWILWVTFLLAFFLALSKRRADVILADITKTDKKNLKLYSQELIEKLLKIIGLSIFILYALYTVFGQVNLRLGNSYAFVTSFWVYLGIHQYLKIIFRTKDYHTPISVILKSTIIQGIVVFWILTFLILFFL